ncbi:MAG: hypothetical protein WDO18_06145 [Acidobacteriota bacterium]
MSENPRFAYDSYRRFIQMFGEVALDIDMEKFDHIFDAQKKSQGEDGYGSFGEGSEGHHRGLQEIGTEGNKKPFPQDAFDQLTMARDAVFRSWWNPKASTIARWKRSPDEIGTRPMCRPWCSATWRRFGHGRGFYAQSVDGRKGVLGRVPSERAR